jgi:hypothetical protein
MSPGTALKESLEVAVASAAKAAQLASVAAAAAASAASKAQEAAGHCDASSEWATESLEAIKVVAVGGYPKATVAARGVAAMASRATGLSTPSAAMRASGAIAAACQARVVTAEVLNKLKDAVAAAEEADAAAMEAVVCAEAWGFFIK